MGDKQHDLKDTTENRLENDFFQFSLAKISWPNSDKITVVLYLT